MKIRKKYAAESDRSHTSDSAQRLWLFDDSLYRAREKDEFVAKGYSARCFSVLIDVPLSHDASNFNYMQAQLSISKMVNRGFFLKIHEEGSLSYYTCTKTTLGAVCISQVKGSPRLLNYSLCLPV